MKTIFFDIGGVLVDLRWDEAAALWHERTGRPAEELAGLLHGDGRKEAFEQGALENDAYFAAVAEAAGDPALRGVVEDVFRTIPAPRPWLEAALDRLALRYHLALISNIDASHYAVFDEAPLYRGLDRTWLSFRTGLRKPHPDVFTGALRYANLRDPQEALLIDDHHENVAAALNAGMRAVYVPNEAAMRAVMDQLVATVRDCPFEKERDCSRTCPAFRTCRGALRRPGRA